MALVQPKKPAGGAYGQFLAEKRAEFVKEVKGQPITAVTKLASARWQALGEEEKKVYQERYVAAKEKYETEMKAFLEKGGEVVKKQKRGAKERVKNKLLGLSKLVWDLFSWEQ